MVYAMSREDVSEVVTATADGVRLAVKVVPGAGRTAVAGLLGDRLKLTVTAPAEGGKANAAVCKLLAKTFGVAKRDVQVVAGHTRPQKNVALTGVKLCAAVERLKQVVSDS